MENMSFDDLSLLLGVTEIQTVPNIIVHTFKNPCCNVTPSRTM
jgi:hypothetical protein